MRADSPSERLYGPEKRLSRCSERLGTSLAPLSGAGAVSVLLSLAGTFSPATGACVAAAVGLSGW